MSVRAASRRRLPGASPRVLAAILLGVLVPACAGAGPKVAARGAAAGDGPSSVVRITPTEGLDLVGHGRLPYRRRLHLPARGPYAVVPLRRFIGMWNDPVDRAPAIFVDTRNPYGQTFRMPVLDVREEPDGSGWLRVLYDEAVRRDGWVHSNDVHVVRMPHRLVVDLSDYTLEHYRDGRLVDRYLVGIGRPEYPTPLGTYFLWTRMPQGMPNGIYGVYAFALSGLQPAIEDGRLGIHGTADPGDRGERVSHGCVRVYNVDMLELKKLPLGTPVHVEA